MKAGRDPASSRLANFVAKTTRNTWARVITGFHKGISHVGPWEKAVRSFLQKTSYINSSIEKRITAVAWKQQGLTGSLTHYLTMENEFHGWTDVMNSYGGDSGLYRSENYHRVASLDHQGIPKPLE